MVTKAKGADQSAPKKTRTTPTGGQVREGASRGGRPPGRPTVRDEEGRTLSEMAAAFSVEALKNLREIQSDPDTPRGVRVAASEAILRRGWADAPPPSSVSAMDGVTINVQQLIVQGAAVPGIMQSPVAEHLAAPASDASEVIDVDGSTIEPSQHEGP